MYMEESGKFSLALIRLNQSLSGKFKRKWEDGEWLRFFFLLFYEIAILLLHSNDWKIIFAQLGSIADRTILEVDLDKDDHISFEEFVKVSAVCSSSW